MDSQYLRYAILMAGVFMLSTSGIFAKIAAAPPAIIALYRLLFTVIALLPAGLRRGSFAEIKKMTRPAAAASALAGFFLSIHYVLWFHSLNYTTVSSSTTLAALQPIFSIILGVMFLHEHFSRKSALGCAIALAGVIVIGWGDFRVSGAALWGDILALISGAVISLYFFFGQLARRTTGTLAYSLLSYSCSVVCLAAYSYLTGCAFSGYPAATWASFIGLAVISTIGGQVVFSFLMQWMPASTVTMGIIAEPVGTCILAFLLLGEQPTLQLLAGMAVILMGLFIFFTGRRQG